MTDESGRKQAGGRKWRPGESGNPKGRPIGSGPAAKLRAAIAKDAPDIIRKLIELAKAGDVRAARVLMERTVPALKAEALPVMVGGIDAGTLTERAHAALQAVGRAEVSPETAAQLLAALAALAGIREADELESRIAALEAVHAQK